jgi:hypothetical protein
MKPIYIDAQKFLDPSYGGFNPFYADGWFAKDCVLRYGEVNWEKACDKVRPIISRSKAELDWKICALD